MSSPASSEPADDRVASDRVASDRVASDRAPRATDTRQSLLDAAERLFAERGIDGTSLRAITAEAGANLAAVNYHFGSKEKLVGEVFSRRLRPLNGERLRRLAECVRGTGRPPIREVVRAFVAPVVEAKTRLAAGGSDFPRLLGQVVAAGAPLTDALLEREFGETYARFQAALGRALPHLGPDELASRYHFMVGAMAHSVANPGLVQRLAARSGGPAEPADGSTLTERLVTFLAAGLECPSADGPAADPTPERPRGGNR